MIMTDTNWQHWKDMFYSREVKVGELCILESMKYGVWCARVSVNERGGEIWKITRQTIHFIICPEFELYSLTLKHR